MNALLRSRVILIGTLAVALMGVVTYSTPAAAITDGVPDTAHPNVGVIGVQTDRLRGCCSGFLISDRHFVAAAHSLSRFKRLGLSPDQLFVSFDADARYTRTLHRVQAYSFHPNFDEQTRENDVGVITLQDPVDIPPVSLPPLGFLDDLARHNGLKDHVFVNVGYGLDANDQGRPEFYEGGIRRVSSSPFEALVRWQLVLNDNTNATGEGGICNGDSGSPTLFGDIGEPGDNLAVGVVSMVDPNCRAMGVSQRLDLPSIRDYLDDYVPLP